MNLFRNLLFWLVLALAGALVAQLLVQDPGRVLVSFRGTDYAFTVVSGAADAGRGAAGGCGCCGRSLMLPFRGWRGFRTRQVRARLTDGLTALQQGHWSRAEKLLAQAAETGDAAAIGARRRGAGRRCARRCGGGAAPARRARRPPSRQRARSPAPNAPSPSDRPTDALVALDAPAAQPLPPRGLLLRAQALAALGRAQRCLRPARRAAPATGPAGGATRRVAGALERSRRCAKPPMPTSSPNAGTRCRSR